MSAQAYPLKWPKGWPTTPKDKREKARFQTTLPAALNNLRRQIELMDGKGLVLSSNYTLGQDNPTDPGVVAYFQYEQAQVAIPCDRWTRLEHNVQAIALTVEAMRGMERWGAKHMIKAMFSGFKMLPAPGEASHWSSVLGVSLTATPAEVKDAYDSLVKKVHPDKPGGSHDAFVPVQRAYEQFKAERT
jgi:hypothetical protein